jgi:pimeloyl-ACP methyl ester carboxylesterase
MEGSVMSSYPQDFEVPLDQGGKGEGQSIAGFGGHPANNRSEHRAKVRSVGKAPVLLLHGNAGAADIGQWDMLDLQQMLLDSDYPQELIWAPSYLGTAARDDDRLDDKGINATPHTNNVNEVRDFLDKICEYLDVDVVDIIAHSLGCSLAYAICRGLKKQRSPVEWDQSKRWGRVGTFVALAGAFHGFGSGPLIGGEWNTDGEFMRELLAEELGGGGETPFGRDKPQTPTPSPHNITYFCGIARNDFVDSFRRDTGQLEGAINTIYDLGPSTIGHERIKEYRSVFEEFLPHLNSVPPVPAVEVTVDKDSGSYDSPLEITLSIDPPDKIVSYFAKRVTKEMRNGNVIEEQAEQIEGDLSNGQALTLSTDGMWEVIFSVEGATDDIKQTYWVGVKAIEVTIVTDNSTSFEKSLNVIATVSNPRARLYHSLNGKSWSEGANVAIIEDAVVHFIAMDPDGIASQIVSKLFKKRIASDDSETANVNEHFIAGRIDVNEYLTYSRQFGFFTPFTLYLVNGAWVLDPDHPIESALAPVLAVSHDSEMFTEPITVTLSARDEADPNPKIYYTKDGSRPTTRSPFFRGSGQIRFDTSGAKTLRFFAQNSAGNSTEVQTNTYEMEVEDVRPVIKVRGGAPQQEQDNAILNITIDAFDDKDDHIIVHYTENGSIPDEHSPSFRDSKQFEISGTGNHAIACYAQDSGGNETYEVFLYSI